MIWSCWLSKKENNITKINYTQEHLAVETKNWIIDSTRQNLSNSLIIDIKTSKSFLKTSPKFLPANGTNSTSTQ